MKKLGVIFFLLAVTFYKINLFAQPFDELKDIKLSDVEDIIAEKNVTTVENLLGSLPEAYLNASTMLYGSRSLQDASFKYPRVIVTGKTAQTIMAFNGHPSQKGYNDIEVIEFNDAKKTFDFSVISFSPTGVTKPVINRNPTTCTGCHHQDSRPNWASYGLWPGAYGSQHMSAFGPLYSPPEENLNYDLIGFDGRYKFIKIREYGRLGGVTRNSFVGKAMAFRNMMRLARKIQQSQALHPYRFTILASMFCLKSETDIEQYMPEGNNNHFANPTRYADDILKKRLNSKEEKISLFKKLLNGSNYLDGPKREAGLSSLTPNRDHPDVIITGALRYIVEANAGESMSDWSMEFEKDSYGFSDGGSIDPNYGYPELGDILYFGIQGLFRPLWEWLKPELPGVQLPQKTFQRDRDYSNFCEALKVKIQSLSNDEINECF